MAEQSNPQLAAGINFTDVLVIIIYLVLIVVAAYFLTKYVAKRSLKKGMKPSHAQRSGPKSRVEFGHMVSVADRIAVDRDKTIMVVEFQGKYYLMSTSADKIECIDTVDVPDAPPVSEEVEMQPGEEPEDAGIVQRPADEDTFFKRFKKCMRVVLQSYLPKSMRSSARDVSFETRLNEQVRKSEKTDEKEKSDQNDTTKG